MDGCVTLRYNDFCEDLSGEEWVSRLDDAVKSVITDENGKICTAPLTQWVYGIVYNADVLEANDIDPYAIKNWDMISKMLAKNWRQMVLLHWISQERMEAL